jgi:hypothetical protein
MRDPRTVPLAGFAAVCAAIAAVLGASAAAGVVVHDSIHDERSFVLEDFCDVAGLDVAVDSTLDIQARIGPRGPDGPLYFVSHGRQHEVLTANGTSLTSDAVVNEKDHEITLNPDGTLTVLVVATGNAVLYGPDGEAIARNPGQLRFELLIDENGTPDPSDDEVTRLGNVKGSTGRSDDYCAAAVAALTGSTS